MNKRYVFFGLVAASLCIVGCSDQRLVAPSHAAARAPVERDLATSPGCELVNGTATFTKFEFTSATTAVSAGVMTGDLVGTFAVQYFDLHQNGDGSGTLDSHHVLTTSAGTILTSDEILLLPVSDPNLFRPVARLNITGGTGAYQGATGAFMVLGEYNHVTLEGSLEYQGRICVPVADAQ